MLVQTLRRLVAACAFMAASCVTLAGGPVRTPGTFQVNSMGAATYNVPVRVPPGVAGIEPKLALFYNSLGGNGWLGLGWKVSGLSSIARCPSTVAQDGTKGSVNYDMNDRFCLDGKRLMLVSGSYGADGSVYHTEIESFATVTAHGSAGNGPAWFDASTKDGHYQQYGNTADSQVKAQGLPTVRVWAQNLLQDNKTNYLTVSYTQDAANGAYYPNQISYTGNSRNATAATNSIQFQYQTRQDAVPSYAGGAAVTLTQQISKILIKQGSSLVKEYQLNYNYDSVSNNSRLLSLMECDADSGGNCLQPIIFANPPSALPTFGTEVTSSTTLDWGYEGTRSWVDFNGDGKADFCRLVGVPGNYQMVCALSSGTGFQDVYSSSLDPGATPPAAGNTWWADVTGAGKPAYCRLVGSAGAYQLACTPSTGTGFGSTIMSGVTWEGYPASRTWADVDGSGRASFCRLLGNPGAYQVACTLSTGTGFGQTIWSNFLDPGIDQTNAGASWWVDVNGDGKADFCRLIGTTDNYQMACTLSTGTGFGQTVTSMVNWSGYDGMRWWADVNGDGLPDFCRLVGNPGAYQVVCNPNTGHGFGPAIWSPILDMGPNPTTPGTAWWADVTGNGKADFCRIVGSAGAYKVACTLSTGTGFSQTVTSGVIDQGFVDGRAMVDMDGNGIPDFCRVGGTGNHQWSYVRCTPISAAFKGMTSVGDIWSGTVINYKPITDPSVYTAGSGASYPVVDQQPPLYVVSSAIYSAGNKSGFTENYTYGGLKTSLDGRGSLGFAWVGATNAISGISTFTNYNQTWPVSGTVSSVTVGSGASLSTLQVLNKTTSTYASVSLGNGVTFVGNTQTVANKTDLNGASFPQVTVSRSYDCQSALPCYGNVSSETSSSSDGYSKTVSTTYVDPVHGLPGQQTVTSTVP